jgi:protein SCO1/2
MNADDNDNRSALPNEPAQSLPWAKLIPALVVLLVIVAGASALLFKGASKPTLPGGAQQAAAGKGFDGTLALPAKAAPQIALRNYLGQRVTLSEYRGKAVLVTFLYTHCPDVCPIITSQLHRTLGLLGSESSKVQIIAVSVDPRGDTPASVASFLSTHGMVGHMQYLLGSPAQLASTWAAWGVGSKREAGQPDLVAHSALIYGISASGKLTTIYSASFQPSEIVHDVPKLASL